jgi:hypothetical protein
MIVGSIAINLLNDRTVSIVAGRRATIMPSQSLLLLFGVEACRFAEERRGLA